ncbi:MAG: Gmad2 immunoglobulin-like domain-containing protein [Dehalococcoidia bacterium]|nr:Gmad2 immunoglobulin-like domain-containing protein [Dehalococcoidia bacterium]
MVGAREMIGLLSALSVAALLMSGCVAGAQVTAPPTPTPVATPTRPSATATIPLTPTAGQPATPPGLRPITVSSPRDGETVSSPIRITGQASVFEGTVRARLRDASGREIARAFGTATTGAPGRGDYTITLPFTGTGPATLEVYWESPRDGSAQDIVAIRLTLR